MSNDSPPESYYIPPDFDDAGEEERKPRGQGCMSDHEYILKLEDAIENADLGEDVVCAFCDTEVYHRHIHGCVYAAIVGYQLSVMDTREEQVKRRRAWEQEQHDKCSDAVKAPARASIAANLPKFVDVTTADLYNSEILLRKMSGG